jgi:bifunctional DNA-binding transcriptional regulator/antitoxin component of YhaV-PrlF toxin-antitoxin module
MSYMVKTTHSTTLTLDAQGRVLLPRPLRKALGLEPGTRLLALVEADMKSSCFLPLSRRS